MRQQNARGNPRRVAVDILNRVEKDQAFAEPLLDRALSGNAIEKPSDRSLLTQLVYGTLRMKGRLDWVLEKLYDGPPADLESSLKNVIRVGLYQITCLDRIPDYAAVDEAVETAKRIRPGRAALVNALLRNAIRKGKIIKPPDYDRDPALHIAIVHSHPLWLVRRWIDLFGAEDTLMLCRANNENPPLTLRTNTLKTSRDNVLRGLREEGIEAQATAFSPDGVTLPSGLARPIRQLDLFRRGLIHVQDEASQLIAHLVNPRPGEKIADLCCGTGGKTTHMAERMKNDGRILAVDLNGKKIRALEANARRLGIRIIETRRGDVSRPSEIPPPAAFDRVLLDAPCSGLGTLRRNPEIKWRLTEEALSAFPLLQFNLLRSASCCVKRGGVLVYSTCSIMPEENDEIIERFLSSRPDFERLDPPGTIPREMIGARGQFRSFPHMQGTDGFYGALLSRQ
ncbi:MAG TPA: 16S rRNA (cytosine(967)-C(5))-methyltransferase RsmB [Syntrophales bacterium]|nr:16S rRNA (cytosine(967)-C(5))-methyltransferase RsmB [Syntrophales bacterium]HQM28533.1 16S rRNA (cytosine(967)-C(5))-methyltransferase RsmB [Syntrophales bacterium]